MTSFSTPGSRGSTPGCQRPDIQTWETAKGDAKVKKNEESIEVDFNDDGSVHSQIGRTRKYSNSKSPTNGGSGSSARQYNRKSLSQPELPSPTKLPSLNTSLSESTLSPSIKDIQLAFGKLKLTGISFNDSDFVVKFCQALESIQSRKSRGDNSSTHSSPRDMVLAGHPLERYPYMNATVQSSEEVSEDQSISGSRKTNSEFEETTTTDPNSNSTKTSRRSEEKTSSQKTTSSKKVLKRSDRSLVSGRGSPACYTPSLALDDHRRMSLDREAMLSAASNSPSPHPSSNWHPSLHRPEMVDKACQSDDDFSCRSSSRGSCHFGTQTSASDANPKESDLIIYPSKKPMSATERIRKNRAERIKMSLDELLPPKPPPKPHVVDLYEFCKPPRDPNSILGRNAATSSTASGSSRYLNSYESADSRRRATLEQRNKARSRWQSGATQALRRTQSETGVDMNDFCNDTDEEMEAIRQATAVSNENTRASPKFGRSYSSPAKSPTDWSWLDSPDANQESQLFRGSDSESRSGQTSSYRRNRSSPVDNDFTGTTRESRRSANPSPAESNVTRRSIDSGCFLDPEGHECESPGIPDSIANQVSDEVITKSSRLQDFVSSTAQNNAVEQAHSTTSHKTSEETSSASSKSRSRRSKVKKYTRQEPDPPSHSKRYIKERFSPELRCSSDDDVESNGGRVRYPATVVIEKDPSLKYWPATTTRTASPAYYNNRSSGRRTADGGTMSPVVTTSHAISLAAPPPKESPVPQMKADIIETDDFTYIICPRNRNKR